MTNALTDIRDIKGLVPVPHSWWWVWVALGVLLAIVLVIWLARRRQPPEPTGETPVPLSPSEIALAALARLREENPAVEEFYTRLSDIVRQYLEGQFGLRAPERTTEEFLYEVSRDDTLSQEHKNLLGSFLQESDLVKFARFRPGTEDRQRAFAAAEKFIRESSSAEVATR